MHKDVMKTLLSALFTMLYKIQMLLASRKTQNGHNTLKALCQNCVSIKTYKRVRKLPRDAHKNARRINVLQYAL